MTGCFKSKQPSLTSKDLYEGLEIPIQREFKLSPKVKACENFHEYVCGETESEFKLPDDRERWTFSFTDNAEKLLHAKKNFFLKIDKYKAKDKRSQQFKDVYQACMNEDMARVEERNFVKEENKVLSKITTNAELADLAQSRLDKGLTSFTYLGQIANKENPLINDAYIISDMRTLPERSYYQNKELIESFKTLLIDFFNTVGMDQAEKRAQWVIDFETRLAMTAPLPNEIRGRFAEKRDISREDFLKLYPELKFNRMLDQVPSSTVLIDVLPENNTFINKALKSEPLEALKSVYAFHSMTEFMDDAYPDFYSKFFNFKSKYLGGPKERSPRQERCTKLVMSQFGMELDYQLMDILFPKFPEDRAIKMGESVRTAIISGLKDNTWLSESTKEEAIKKIKLAKLHLVKPQKDKDWDFMPVKKYDPTQPYANLVLHRTTSFAQTLQELKEPRNPDKWYMSPLVVNAYYSGSDNKFVLPQGILQFPFFSADMKDFENIAAIGMIVGHELGHGIDDKGSKYDFEGKVREWFTEEDLKNFKERGDRFISQFDKIGHDGKLTLGENIGDHVGLTFSYNAAFPEADKISAEDKQKFYVAYARMWCGVRTDSYKQKQLKTDPHSIGYERINQQVIHMPSFHEAFGCQAGDKMFLPAQDRIRIW
jgi:putative endopeptidase